MTRIISRNILAALPESPDEVFETLLERPGLRLERIVSSGQASPAGEWYDQKEDEWVLLLSGSAGILIEGEGEPRRLAVGDFLLLPAGCRHRVDWTASADKTVWLALHVAV